MKKYNKQNYHDFDFYDNVVYETTHQRENISFTTYDLEIVYEKHNQGWSFTSSNDGFIVRAPEDWLVDLTDPYKILHYNDHISNLAFYNYIRDLIYQYNLDTHIDKVLKKEGIRGLQIYLVKGRSIESEFRIAGSNLDVKKVKNYIFKDFRESKDWNKYYCEAKEFLGETRQFKKDVVLSPNEENESKLFVQTILNHYRPLDSFRKDNFINEYYIESLFKNIPKVDVYLFVPWGCFYYICSFLKNNDDLSKIMFWEYHSSTQRQSNKFLSKDLKSKKVLVIDNSYTGITLTNVSQLVRDERGIPIRLALFPKSKLSITNSEYVLIGDKILESKKINLISGDWIRQTYKDIFTNEKK